jgi:hypothetical protein
MAETTKSFYNAFTEEIFQRIPTKIFKTVRHVIMPFGKKDLWNHKKTMGELWRVSTKKSIAPHS